MDEPELRGVLEKQRHWPARGYAGKGDVTAGRAKRGLLMTPHTKGPAPWLGGGVVEGHLGSQSGNVHGEFNPGTRCGGGGTFEADGDGEALRLQKTLTGGHRDGKLEVACPAHKPAPPRTGSAARTGPGIELRVPEPPQV